MEKTRGTGGTHSILILSRVLIYNNNIFICCCSSCSYLLSERKGGCCYCGSCCCCCCCSHFCHCSTTFRPPVMFTPPPSAFVRPPSLHLLLFTPARLCAFIWPSFVFVWHCPRLYLSSCLLTHACLHPLGCTPLFGLCWIPATLL